VAFGEAGVVGKGVGGDVHSCREQVSWLMLWFLVVVDDDPSVVGRALEIGRVKVNIFIWIV
jgi:hypothetical protein